MLSREELMVWARQNITDGKVKNAILQVCRDVMLYKAELVKVNNLLAECYAKIPQPKPVINKDQYVNGNYRGD